MPPREPKDLERWLESVIIDFVTASPKNNLASHKEEQAFDVPLVGFSKGDDPLYESYKELVGPYHWTPKEIFSLAFPDSRVDSSELTVISWILPQTAATKKDNRKESFYPAERWARAKTYGEAMNVKLRAHLVEALKREGYDAVAPLLFGQYEMKKSDRYVLASTWSERHAAHAGGLGTFGLCDGLITPKGKAMRAGSVVARIEVPPTPRPYDNHYAYCLFLAQGTCGRCISRCPVGAITEAGHDKLKCHAHLRPTTEDHIKSEFRFDGYSCGLCQTGVPCESRIPVKSDLE